MKRVFRENVEGFFDIFDEKRKSAEKSSESCGFLTLKLRQNL